MISTLLADGGPIMPLIVLAAAVGYLLAFERLLAWGWWWFRDRSLRRLLANPERDGESLGGWIRAASSGHDTTSASGEPVAFPFGDYKTRGRTPLAALLIAARPLFALPVQQREPALEALLLARVPKMDTRISTIGWLGSILPLLGLLGTVSGMITTFQDLAVTSSRQILSQGLSEALWTTEIGLIGAVPLLAAHHLLGRVKARWLNALEHGLARLSLQASVSEHSATGSPAAGKGDTP